MRKEINMDIFEPINQSHALLLQLSVAINSNNESGIKTVLNALASNLEQIKTNTSNLQQQVTQLGKNQTTAMKQAAIIIARPELQSGCYIFPGEKGFFCPRCYDNQGNKIATTRLNSKQRICPVCRASLK
jgi:cell division protein FtsB